MTNQTFLLADATQHEFTPHHLNFDSTGIKVGGSTDWSIHSLQYGYGPSQGVHQVNIRLGDVSVDILPTRGMGIWKASINRHRLGWDSPVKFPMHPNLVNQLSRNKLAWLDGFNELLCRCGLSSNGPPGIDHGSPSPVVNDLSLHGNIANIPAYWVECTISQSPHKTEHSTTTCHISLTGKVLESGLFGPNLELTSTIKLTLGEAGFIVEDQVTNLATSSSELELLYHINVGEPFLGAGSEFIAPVSRVVSRDPRAEEGKSSWTTYLGPTNGYAEQVYFCKIFPDGQGLSQVMLTNEKQKLGLALAYSSASLPCFTLWKNTQGKSDGYCTGLEAGTNFPNFKDYERKHGRVVNLPAGETYHTVIKFTSIEGTENLELARDKIRSIQGNAATNVAETCQPGWSAAGDK